MPHVSLHSPVGDLTIIEEDGALVALEWGRAPDDAGAIVALGWEQGAGRHKNPFDA